MRLPCARGGKTASAGRRLRVDQATRPSILRVVAGSEPLRGLLEDEGRRALLGVRLPRWVTALALLTSAGLLAETIRPTVTPHLVPRPPSGSDEQKVEQRA